MGFAKKIIVAVGISNNAIELLSPMRDMEFLSHSEIHFVHVFNSFNYSSVPADLSSLYPVAPDLKVVELSIMDLLLKTSQEVLPPNFKGKVIQKFLFAENPKEKFVEYVTGEKADLVIIPTRQKRGYFESSFAQYVNRRTTANMFLLKAQV
jgi:hypothetical protein